MRKWTLGLMLMMLAGAATGNTPEKVVLDAANMTCPACSITIEKALEKVPGVTGTQVDTKAATVTVTFDSELTSIPRSEEHTSELQSLMRSSYAVFCLKKTTTPPTTR